MEVSAEEYHSSDFQWEDLKNRIESDPSLHYHILPFQSSQHHQLKPEARQKKVQDLLTEDSEAWQTFHTRHSSGKFFKERRYLLKEFPELVACGEYSKLLEVGCGNGSSVLPILRGNKNMVIYACDCSTEALERTEESIRAANLISDCFRTFCCDFSTTGFSKWLACNPCQETSSRKQQSCFSDVEENGRMLSHDNFSLKESSCCVGGVDFITLIFTLSAVPVQQMPTSIRNCFSVLKPGGLVLFRDYGLYDMTMLRFKPDQRLGFREYMRSDGTRSYFFSLDTVRSLFVGAGFTEVELEYCCVKSLNRRNGKNMERVWVHGKFRKPI